MFRAPSQQNLRYGFPNHLNGHFKVGLGYGLFAGATYSLMESERRLQGWSENSYEQKTYRASGGGGSTCGKESLPACWGGSTISDRLCAGVGGRGRRMERARDVLERRVGSLP